MSTGDSTAKAHWCTEEWPASWMWNLLCSMSSSWYCYIHLLRCLLTTSLFICSIHFCVVDIDDELGAKSGSETDYTCDNPTCSKAFHSVCLGDWLRSITTTRQYVDFLVCLWLSMWFMHEYSFSYQLRIFIKKKVSFYIEFYRVLLTNALRAMVKEAIKCKHLMLLNHCPKGTG